MKQKKEVKKVLSKEERETEKINNFVWAIPTICNPTKISSFIARVVLHNCEFEVTLEDVTISEVATAITDLKKALINDTLNIFGSAESMKAYILSQPNKNDRRNKV